MSQSCTMRRVLSLVILCSSFSTFATGIKTTSTTITPTIRKGSSSSLAFVGERLRGGASSDSSSKKKKKKKGSKGKAKKVIDDAMKEKDSAEALGDAIRDRADILRNEGTSSDPVLESIDRSVASVGRAAGASDFDADAGGVEASPEAVIANYFLKSHGGAHLLQTACSVMAQIFGIGSLFMVVKYSAKDASAAAGNAKWTLALLRQTMIFAMIKHISGLLASASLAAKAIPKIGISQSRKWMEDIVREPVAQYVFYTAMMLLWLPGKAFEDATSTVSTIWWWPKQRWITTLFVAPILMREVVSNILVLYDTMVLWSVTSKDDNAILEKLLQYSQSIVNAVMSLVVSPEKWRSADSAGRQEILATLVSKTSLFAECGVGAILAVDLVVGFMRVVFGILGGRPVWHEMLTKIVIVRLYVHYLVWARRTNIVKLATEIRGGAAQLPFWVLDSLYDPAKALGLSKAKITTEDGDNDDKFSWKETLTVGLGLNETPKKKARSDRQ